ncbi:MAG: hypothetical protein JWM80_5341, partial [Cyanobacteria bacterium RYN_339]|nr:hypothetical protein [Cyanobacteria bacterium RYN_339]
MSIGLVGPRLLSWGASFGTPAGQVLPAQNPVAQPAPFGADVFVPSAAPQAALDRTVSAQLSQLTQQLMQLQAELATLMQNQPPVPGAPGA